VLAEDGLAEPFRYLKTHPQRALDAAEVLLDRYSEQSSTYTHVVQLKARALLNLNKADDCIALINSLGPGIRAGKGVLMCKARALQAKGCLHEALLIFQHLYATHRGNARTDKTQGLALGRALEMKGGADNLEQALAIYTQLRTRVAGGKVNSPCDDKDIEVTLGRLLQRMGGTDNLQKALAIYTRLRMRAAGGRPNTPCNDKDIELTLCRHLQFLGGEDNLKQALAIYTRLRTRAAHGKHNTPCDDPDIELTLASFYLNGRAWSDFDQLRLETRRFPGFESCLCLSVRYFQELLETRFFSSAHSRLLGQAVRYAALAVEDSNFINASCISQLAHCVRLLSYWPKALLQRQAITYREVRAFATAAKVLFDTSSQISPCRLQLAKNRGWRLQERELLGLLLQHQGL